MAREKQIIAELKERGVDPTGAERTLAQLSACLLVLEDQGWQFGKKGTKKPRPPIKRAPAEASAVG
jgi:hypothetical protein